MTEAQTPAAPGAARPTVAMLMYSGMTMLDLVGPLETLSQMTKDHEEAVAAFAEKRKPRFTGR